MATPGCWWRPRCCRRCSGPGRSTWWRRWQAARTSCATRARSPAIRSAARRCAHSSRRWCSSPCWSRGWLRMRRCAELLAAALSLLALAVAPAVRAEGLPRLDERVAMQASLDAVGTTPPDFTLLDRRGQAVRLSDYRGKPLLVSFIYTGCFTVCPLTTRSLHDAVRGLDRMLGPR